MFKVIQSFGKHSSCHLQGEYILVECFLEAYVEQAVGGEWEVCDKTGVAECRSGPFRICTLNCSRENRRPRRIRRLDGQFVGYLTPIEACSVRWDETTIDGELEGLGISVHGLFLGILS
jgi:hypothetical protein